jgi:hypothetical protein
MYLSPYGSKQDGPKQASPIQVMTAKYRRPVKKTLQRCSKKHDEIVSNFIKICGALGRQQPLDCHPPSQMPGFSLNPRISSKRVARRLLGPVTLVNGPLSTPMDQPRNFPTEDRFNSPN